MSTLSHGPNFLQPVEGERDRSQIKHPACHAFIGQRTDLAVSHWPWYRGAMLSHNSVNGIPAHMHKEIMTEIIRGEWNHSRVFFASDL